MSMVVGDQQQFSARSEQHRRELHVHCYRMLASFDEAEDGVQTFGTALFPAFGLPMTVT